MNPTEAKPKRSWKGKLMLSLGVALATILVLEGIASLVLGKHFERGQFVGNNWIAVGQRDSQFGWSNRPGASGHIHAEVFEYDVQINSLGFRDPERTLKKTPGVKRVVLLGDSVTWGWGVDNGVRFSDLLEEEFGGQVEFLNLGVPGYGTDQQYWNLQARGWDFDPDLVIHLMVMNDILEAEMNEHYSMPKPRFVRAEDGAWSVERPAGLHDAVGLRNRAKRWYRTLQANSSLLTWMTRGEVQPVDPNYLDNLTYHMPKETEKAQVETVANMALDEKGPSFHAMELMAKVCAERGVPLLVSSFPHKHDRYLYEPGFPRPAWAQSPNFQGALSLVAQELGKRLGFAVVDLDRAMLAKTNAGVRLHCGDGHPNEVGHRLIADELLPVVRGLLKTD